MLGLSAFAQSSSRPVDTVSEPDSYQLELAVTKGWKIISRPRLTVAFSEIGKVTVGQDGKDGGIRLEVLAKPAGITKAGTRVVAVSASVFQEVAGAWVLLSQPSMRAAEGEAARIKFDIANGPLQLDIRAVPRNIASESSAKRVNGSATCAAERQRDRLTTLDFNCPQLPCDDEKKCCSFQCTDGRKFTCCASGGCCDDICGGCCTPPL